VKYLEKLRGGPLTFGALLRSILRPTSTRWRISQSASASRAPTSATSRRAPWRKRRARARWARISVTPRQFSSSSRCSELDAAGIKLKIDVKRPDRCLRRGIHAVGWVLLKSEPLARSFVLEISRDLPHFVFVPASWQSFAAGHPILEVDVPSFPLRNALAIVHPHRRQPDNLTAFPASCSPFAPESTLVDLELAIFDSSVEREIPSRSAAALSENASAARAQSLPPRSKSNEHACGVGGELPERRYPTSL